jgi:hypothetical protein
MYSPGLSKFWQKAVKPERNKTVAMIKGKRRFIKGS